MIFKFTYEEKLLLSSLADGNPQDDRDCTPHRVLINRGLAQRTGVGQMEITNAGRALLFAGSGCTMSKRRPTKTQRKILAAMAAGTELVQHFDVYGGYSHTIGEEPVRKTTVEALFYGRLIENGRPLRVFSGRQRMVYKLTAAGSAALSSRERA